MGWKRSSRNEDCITIMDYSLKVIKPTSVTDAMLISTDVPEDDYPVWSSATTYALGARVIVVADHSVYESLQATNTAHTPSTSPTWWIRVGPTNRWKLFDTSNSTQTVKASSMSYTLKPGNAITAVGVLNLTGATSIRVRLIDPTYGTVYDKTTDLSALPELSDWWHWFFGVRSSPSLNVLTDLPSFPDSQLTVDITGTVDLAVGVLIFGQAASIGIGIEYGARVGIQDYSRKETNEFGDIVLVQRAFAKRANFDMKLTKGETDSIQSILANLRATPCLWIGSSLYESTIIYGFYKDFDISISYPTYSDCSIEIEGLT